MYSQESTFLKDILLQCQNFQIQNSNERVSFNPDESFVLSVAGATGQIDGRFEIEFVTFEKGELKQNPDMEITFTLLNYILDTGKKDVWVFKAGLAKVEEGVVYLPFFHMNAGFDSPPVILIHKIESKLDPLAFDWSSIIGGSRFLKTVDFTNRVFFSFIIEEAITKPNEEEALEFALNKLLRFNDEERRVYGEIIKKLITEKYRSKN